ncbi:MAG: DUF4157 domain-containing protein, partial [Mariniphaga sp.]
MFKAATKNTGTKSNNTLLFQNNEKARQTFFQPKLNVGTPGDKYEVEADKIADQVIDHSPMTEQSFFTPTISPTVNSGQPAPVQNKPVADSITPLLQRQDEEEEMMQMQPVEEEEERIQSQAEEEQETIQRQPEEEEESLQMQPVEEEEEEMVQGQMEEDEMVQQQQDEGNEVALAETAGSETLQQQTENIQPAMPNQAFNSIQKQEVEEEEPAEVQALEDEERRSVMVEKEGQVQAKADSAPAIPAGFESGLNGSKGSGSPLPSGVRSRMESGFGTDFSNVRIHTGSGAAQMSRQIGAQAFTHGSDIYFNEGKFNPASQSGQHLIAHELTHTVQQGASVQPKRIQRQNEETNAGVQQDPNEILKTFYVPAVKARHLQVYQAWASQRKLKRLHNFSRDTNAEDKPRQVTNWKNHYWDKLQNIENIGLHEEFSGVKKIKVPGNREIRGRRRTLLKNLTIPDWDKNGVVQEGKDRFEVDHIVELQVAGWADNQEGNDFPNLELLDGRSNAAAGSKTRSNVEHIVLNYLEATEQEHSQSDAQRYLAANDLVFERAELGSGDFAGESRTSKYWTR